MSCRIRNDSPWLRGSVRLALACLGMRRSLRSISSTSARNLAGSVLFDQHLLDAAASSNRHQSPGIIEADSGSRRRQRVTACKYGYAPRDRSRLETVRRAFVDLESNVNGQSGGAKPASPDCSTVIVAPSRATDTTHPHVRDELGVVIVVCHAHPRGRDVRVQHGCGPDGDDLLFGVGL